MLLFKKFDISILNFIQNILTKGHVHAKDIQFFIKKQIFNIATYDFC